jgi:hypothetical protein
LKKNMGWATFWATFFTNSSGQPGLEDLARTFPEATFKLSRKRLILEKTEVKQLKLCESGGRCYDHYFPRFSPIFG